MKEKSPKFLYTAPDIPISESGYRRYVEQEMERWVNGSDGFTGEHYFYLTQGTLKNINGDKIRPTWRDADEMIFETLTETKKLKQDLLIVKRREIGLSSIFGGCMPIHTALVNSGSISLMTSADKERVKKLYADKTLIFYEGLDKEFKPARLYESGSTRLHFGKKNKFRDIEGNSSEIKCIETADNDDNSKAFEGYRAKYIFLDEIFLHKRATMVHASAQSTTLEGFDKSGIIVMGGSCGVENIKDAERLKKGAAMGQQLWYDAEHKGINTLFIPGWMCVTKAPEYDKNGKNTGRMLNFCVNGWSDKEKATEWILRHRDKLEKAQDKTSYYNFIKQYPLNIDEVFEINRMGSFPQEVYTKLNIAKKEIQANLSPILQCDLYLN